MAIEVLRAEISALREQLRLKEEQLHKLISNKVTTLLVFRFINLSESNIVCNCRLKLKMRRKHNIS